LAMKSDPSKQSESVGTLALAHIGAANAAAINA